MSAWDLLALLIVAAAMVAAIVRLAEACPCHADRHDTKDRT